MRDKSYTYRIIELTEFVPQTFAQDELPQSTAHLLWSHYSRQVAIQFPTFQTDNQWVLTAQGWVGFIPLSSELGISLQPKVPLANLFGMLEYAHDLKNFRWLKGFFEAQSLAAFYQRLAQLFAQRVLQRCQQGIYREYRAVTEPLPYVRGRLELASMLRKSEREPPICHYEEQSADIEDNQILTWALYRILKSGLCTNPYTDPYTERETLPTVRRAYRQMRLMTTLKPYTVQACQARHYHRLNEDYQMLHGLAAFFLDESGPSHEMGGQTMVPFLVDMARLYERFVARWLAHWLKQHLGPEFRVQAQERQPIGNNASIYFNIDLTIYNSRSGQVRWVMDTKYKLPTATLSTSDIAQAIAYAQVKGASETILIYPAPIPQPLDIQSENIRIRSLTFSLNGDLEEAGHSFLKTLIQSN